jgi:hypothetical protein
VTLRLDSIVVLAARLRYPYHQNRLEWCLYPRFTFSQIKWSVVTIVKLDRVRRLGEPSVECHCACIWHTYSAPVLGCQYEPASRRPTWGLPADHNTVFQGKFDSSVRKRCLRNRICRQLVPFCHCPHQRHDPTDNRPTKNQIDVEYSPDAFHMHPPRQDCRHEIKNSADNEQDPFGDLHGKDSPIATFLLALSIQRCQ